MSRTLKEKTEYSKGSIAEQRAVLSKAQAEEGIVLGLDREGPWGSEAAAWELDNEPGQSADPAVAFL